FATARHRLQASARRERAATVPRTARQCCASARSQKFSREQCSQACLRTENSSWRTPCSNGSGWVSVFPVKPRGRCGSLYSATHTTGLPREIERPPGPDDNPFATITKEAFIKNLQSDPLLFAPGTGALYSNFAFDLLAAALANSAGTFYATLLQDRVLKPASLTA